MDRLDIIIPVYNEASSIKELVERIDIAFRGKNIDWGIIFVDDNSTDETVSEITKLIATHLRPIREKQNVIYSVLDETDLLKNQKRIKLIIKKGKKGKAYSIIEASRQSKSEYLVMIDGDLQYPPEAIPEMFKLAKDGGICIAERKQNETTRLRKTLTKLNKFFVEKMILKFDVDVQSGLKVFKRDIIENINENKVKPWSLDMHLLVIARDLGYQIKTFDVSFSKRKNDDSKVNLIKTLYDILTSALKLRLEKGRIYKIYPISKHSAIGSGFIYKGKRFVTHTLLSREKSALETFTKRQKTFFYILLTVIFTSIIISPKHTAIFFISFLSLLYFTDFIFSLLLLSKSLRKPPEIRFSDEELKNIKENNLPTYSILCPLYKESKVLPQFVNNISNIDWPKDKLDVLLLLEEDDLETLSAAKKENLPDYFRILIVPHSKPKTKPKACNYGFNFVKGKYVVIYDAEDKPDPLQLKKAYLGFERSEMNVVCLQSKLNYYNAKQNILTRLFTAEYSLWFDLTLPGFQLINTVIPLGGTSNHFKVKALKFLDGWDAFNVTEDCDLGVRLFKEGFNTAIIDSTTYEEANSRLKSWLKQRSRWIKGYLQTYLVHMREPYKFIKKHGIHAFIFQLVIGARMTFMVINPILWLVTIAYFVFNAQLGETIESLYPGAVFYIATIPFIFGNFIYLYNYMIALAKRGLWNLLEFAFLVPFYWILTSVSAFIAAYQLFVKPYYWEKTEHGLHLSDRKSNFGLPQLRLNVRFNYSFPKFILSSLKKAKDYTTYENSQKVVLESARERTKFISSGIGGELIIDKARSLKDRLLSERFIGGTLLVFTTVVANFLNFVYNAYLSKNVNLEDFGTLAFYGNFYTLTSIFTGALAATVSHKTAGFMGKFSIVKPSFWKNVRKRSLYFSFFLTILWISLINSLNLFFNTESVLPFVYFTPVWFFGVMLSVNNGFISGTLNFLYLSGIVLISPIVKLLLTVFLIKLRLVDYIYLAISASIAVSSIISWLVARNISLNTNEKVEDELKFPLKFFSGALLNKLSLIAFLSLDVVLAKHLLTPSDAGIYSLLSLTGKVIFFAGSLFVQFINPIVSKNENVKEKDKNVFNLILSGTVLSGVLGYVAIGIFGKITLTYLFGDKVVSILSYLPIFGFGVLSFTISTAIITYHLAKKDFAFSYLGGFLILVQFFATLVYARQSLHYFVLVSSLIGFVYLISSLILHFNYKRITDILGNTSVLLTFFKNEPSLNNHNNDKLRVLILNWRDIKHKWSGGAEIYIHEIAKKWVEVGHEVTIFCSNDGNSKNHENISGVNVIRRGGFYTVYLWAFIFYFTNFRKRIDVIVDCENGIPFFTPLYSNLPKVMLLHHIHENLFKERYGKPLTLLAKIIETKLMPLVYRKTRVVTVSESSKKDALRIGLGKIVPIDIVNPAIDPSIFKPTKKYQNPTLLYLGRLMPWKSVETLIRAIPEVLIKFPNLRVKIAGFGESRQKLEKLSEKLKLTKTISFLGKISDDDKIINLAKSWIFVYPSQMEGWGIAAIEASASGTSVIASNVPGLKDSVKDLVTGLLFTKGNVKELSKKISYLLSNKKVRREMEKEGIKWANNFTWQNNSEEFMEILRGEIRGRSYAPGYIFATVKEVIE